MQRRGEFNWKHQHVFLTETLAGEGIGLEPIDDGYWCVYFPAFPIALFDSEALAVETMPESENEIGGWKSGNLKTGDSQIPTAATATAGSLSRENKQQTTGPNV